MFVQYRAQMVPVVSHCIFAWAAAVPKRQDVLSQEDIEKAKLRKSLVKRQVLSTGVWSALFVFGRFTTISFQQFRHGNREGEAHRNCALANHHTFAGCRTIVSTEHAC